MLFQHSVLDVQLIPDSDYFFVVSKVVKKLCFEYILPIDMLNLVKFYKLTCTTFLVSKNASSK
jgi:hypothetical protein